MPADVVVRFARTAVLKVPERARAVQALLDRDELKVAMRMRSVEARREYVAAHALVRTMLAPITGFIAARLRFLTEPTGRPELAPECGGLRYRFSLSHADGIALCAVARGRPVGADVESLRNVPEDVMGLAADVCSPAQRAVLESLPHVDRRTRFLSMWTQHEAVKKLPPAPGRSALHLQSFWLTPRHLATVAVATGSVDELEIKVEEDELDCDAVPA